MSESYSGTCGKNLNWKLKDGVLTISGSGEMDNYGRDGLIAPWEQFQESIQVVQIQNGVSSIGYDAFTICSSLKSVTIPDSVTSISEEAFYPCNSLTSIQVSQSNKSYCSIDGDLFSKDESCLIRYSIGKPDIAYEFPNNITKIGDSAFSFCQNLTTVTIPDHVTSIGDWAFYCCWGLTSIIIPGSVKSIGHWAFSDCRNLTNVTILDGVSDISDEVFEHCLSLTNLIIPASVTSIGRNAFTACKSLKAVHYLGTKAQWDQIQISDGNESLKRAELRCEKILASGTCGEDLTWELENGVLTISGTGEMDNFEYNKNSPWYQFKEIIKSVNIQYGTASIGDCAFSYCCNLTSVTIPNSVMNIGKFAFYDCSSLTCMAIPSSVMSIGILAFAHCSSLTRVTIPSSVMSIGRAAFSRCSSLTEIQAAQDNLYYCSIDGNLFNKGKSHLFQYSIGKADMIYHIPRSVTSIDFTAFGGCNRLVSVTIPDSVTSVAFNAFSCCTSLQTVNYLGTQAQWNQINISDGNEDLMHAELHLKKA